MLDTNVFRSLSAVIDGHAIKYLLFSISSTLKIKFLIGLRIFVEIVCSDLLLKVFNYLNGMILNK